MGSDSSIYLIGRIRERVHDYLMRELESYGVADFYPSHGDIISVLYARGDLSMTDLANAIHRDRSTVTTLVKKLIKEQYVLSTANNDDRRYSIISLTEKGRALKPIFMKISDEMFLKEYQGVLEEEQKVFLNVLKKVFDNFE